MSADRGADILEAIQNSRIPASTIDQYLDPLWAYRQIDRLFVIGPAELDRICRSNNPANPNPLGLSDNWIPDIPVPDLTGEWIRSCIWRDDPEWATRAFLVLTPPRIGNIPTSLIGQSKLWGRPHDNIPAGIIRQDVFREYWFVQPNYDWANEPAVAKWQWLLGYEHPLWTAKRDWKVQQDSARERGMLISTVAQDAFCLNAVLAATGEPIRSTTWSRAVTISDGCPLGVSSDPRGVGVNRNWHPEDADDDIAASARGVPGNCVP